MVKKTPNIYIYAIGRRKSAVATIKLYKGKGESLVNDLGADKYFPGSTLKINLDKPFSTTKTIDKYHFTAKISGGGKNGQLEALVLAVARALKKDEADFGPLLRAAGLLTVDSRVRERRMVGTGGKARRQKQSPKR